MKLSVAIIAKNEAESIRRCLDSVQGADEIVVCDTGSEDETVAISKRYTDKVFTDYKWADNFSEARNHARSKCTGDWIFTIDCDNRLVEGMDKVREEITRAEKANVKTVSIKVLFEEGNRFSHWLPFLYKNEPEIYWKGAVHNYLTRDDKHYSDLSISCWYGSSHHKDTDRSFRILKRQVAADGDNLVREKFYLAREYYSRRDFEIALYWYKEYFKKAYWGPEMADAYLMMARCLWYLQRGDEARATCLTAIGINTHFKEAILFMSEMSGPINRERWLEFAELADNSGVLFVRSKAEWTADQYDRQFMADSNMSRYEEIQKEVGRIVGDATVLDIGCGPGKLAPFVKNYSGFDFSEEAVKIAANPNVWVGSAYDKANFNGAEYYICTEVLEHLDDFKVIGNIPSGKKVIFSVPSFDDESHIRTFNEAVIKIRYGALFDFKRIRRFNWRGRWEMGGESTQSYILLAEVVKR
jgi:glycosyltransferase involved in cell wall biosynthesis